MQSLRPKSARWHHHQDLVIKQRDTSAVPSFDAVARRYAVQMMEIGSEGNGINKWNHYMIQIYNTWVYLSVRQNVISLIKFLTFSIITLKYHKLEDHISLVSWKLNYGKVNNHSLPYRIPAVIVLFTNIRKFASLQYLNINNFGFLIILEMNCKYCKPFFGQ